MRVLVAGDGGVYGARPVVYAADEGLGVIKALIAQPHGDGEGAHAVVAEDDDWLIGIKLCVGAGGDLIHGDKGGVGKGGGGKLPVLSDVKQEWCGSCGVTQGDEVLRSDLWVEDWFRHDESIARMLTIQEPDEALISIHASHDLACGVLHFVRVCRPGPDGLYCCWKSAALQRCRGRELDCKRKY